MAQIGVVLEYMPVDLTSFICLKKELDMSNISKYSIKFWKGIHYLDRKKIVHRELKPSNILIDENYNVKFVTLDTRESCIWWNCRKQTRRVFLFQSMASLEFSTFKKAWKIKVSCPGSEFFKK